MFPRQGLNFQLADNFVVQHSIFNWISTAIGALAFLGSAPEGFVRAIKLTQTRFILTDS